MTRFVKFSNPVTPNNSVPVYINPDSVSFVAAGCDGVSIYYKGDGKRTVVQYDIEEVMRMLSHD